MQYDLVEGRRSAGEASLYARPGDERDLARLIVELLDDEPRRLKMGAEGLRRMTEELEWRHQAPRLLHAYRHLLAKPRRARPAGRMGLADSRCNRRACRMIRRTVRSSFLAATSDVPYDSTG